MPRPMPLEAPVTYAALPSTLASGGFWGGWKAAPEAGVFWAAHQVDLAYAQIERLCNLAVLPLQGFQVACFPLRIERASAAPARVVAILPD